MITAVRNGPIRTVDKNTSKIAAVAAKLSAARHAQLTLVCGMV